MIFLFFCVLALLAPLSSPAALTASANGVYLEHFIAAVGAYGVLMVQTTTFLSALTGV